MEIQQKVEALCIGLQHLLKGIEIFQVNANDYLCIHHYVTGNHLQMNNAVSAYHPIYVFHPMHRHKKSTCHLFALAQSGSSMIACIHLMKYRDSQALQGYPGWIYHSLKTLAIRHQ